MVACIEVALRGGGVGLLDEAQHPAHALAARLAGLGLDVAEAGFRRFGHDAESHQRAVPRRRNGRAHGGLERRHVADHMVGGQHQQQRVIVLRRRLQRCRGDRRRGVAANRLEHDRGVLHADLAQLLRGEETVFLVGDHDRCGAFGQRRNPQPGVLQHRALAGQRQELLRIGLARQRPQPRARAARKDYRDHGKLRFSVNGTQAAG